MTAKKTIWPPACKFYLSLMIVPIHAPSWQATTQQCCRLPTYLYSSRNSTEGKKPTFIPSKQVQKPKKGLLHTLSKWQTSTTVSFNNTVLSNKILPTLLSLHTSVKVPVSRHLLKLSTYLSLFVLSIAFNSFQINTSAKMYTSYHCTRYNIFFLYADVTKMMQNSRKENSTVTSARKEPANTVFQETARPLQERLHVRRWMISEESFNNHSPQVASAKLQTMRKI